MPSLLSFVFVCALASFFVVFLASITSTDDSLNYMSIPPLTLDDDDEKYEINLPPQHDALMKTKRKKLLNRYRSRHGTLQNVDDLFIHIPKAAGVTARNKMNSILQAMNISDKLSVVCDIGTHQFDRFREWGDTLVQVGFHKVRGSGAKLVSVAGSNHTNNIHFILKECKMHMSETMYPFGANNTRVYTIMRSPSEHVLSQYFHCAESHNHRAELREKMPSLDEWLTNWVSFMETGVSPVKMEKHHHLHMRWMYKCYNPINFQSRILGFDGNLSQEIGKEELNQRLEVIGLTTQFDKSICLILTHLTGEVPIPCDCTSKRRLSETNSGVDHGGHSHGVKNHGASFNVSESQRQALSKLTKIDQTMFQDAEEIFEENLRRTEEKYSVKLCDKIVLRKTGKHATKNNLKYRIPLEEMDPEILKAITKY